jgi:hypothetical protein
MGGSRDGKEEGYVLITSHITKFVMDRQSYIQADVLLVME